MVDLKCKKIYRHTSLLKKIALSLSPGKRKDPIILSDSRDLQPFINEMEKWCWATVTAPRDMYTICKLYDNISYTPIKLNKSGTHVQVGLLFDSPDFYVMYRLLSKSYFFSTDVLTKLIEKAELQDVSSSVMFGAGFYVLNVLLDREKSMKKVTDVVKEILF